MSTPFKFMVASGRRAEISADLRSSSSLAATLVLRRSGPIDRPVDLALKLKSFGLGLSEAHKALNRIVADEAVTLHLDGPDRGTIVAELAGLGVQARDA